MGGSLVNLVADLERHLAGSAVFPGLRTPTTLPAADGYVLVLFDGLGRSQLGHPAAGALAAGLAATLDAPFPTTTTVSLASVATGLPPSRHGLLAYQLWLPALGAVANTIRWTTLWGDPLEVDTTGFLPSPNLWERLATAGIEPITVQPAGFEGSPLTRLLYRGCRFEGVATYAEMIDATVQLARPGRLLFTYVPQIDFAAHVHGQRSDEYEAALRLAGEVWDGITRRLAPGVVAAGTGDHGHVDFPRSRQVRLTKAQHADRILYGDGRAMFVRGDGAALAGSLPARWWPRESVLDWWGPGPRHPAFDERVPDGVLLADPGYLLLHRFSDDRMIGNHGGLTPEERVVPLLLAGG